MNSYLDSMNVIQTVSLLCTASTLFVIITTAKNVQCHAHSQAGTSRSLNIAVSPCCNGFTSTCLEKKVSYRTESKGKH